jgi:ribosomal protein L18
LRLTLKRQKQNKTKLKIRREIQKGKEAKVIVMKSKHIVQFYIAVMGQKGKLIGLSRERFQIPCLKCGRNEYSKYLKSDLEGFLLLLV